MLSLASLLDLYLGQCADLRSLPAQRAAFARHVIPALGATIVTELRRSEIAFMLDRVAARAGPVMADRTLAYLRAALNWYEARTDDWRSPVVRGMVRTGEQQSEPNGYASLSATISIRLLSLGCDYAFCHV
jgi:hypothetical protein